MKVFFPAGIPRVEVPLKTLKNCTSAAGLFISVGNMNGLWNLLEGMKIPAVHQIEAAKQLAERCYCLQLIDAAKWISIGRSFASFLATRKK